MFNLGQMHCFIYTLYILPLIIFLMIIEQILPKNMLLKVTKIVVIIILLHSDLFSMGFTVINLILLWDKSTSTQIDFMEKNHDFSAPYFSSTLDFFLLCFQLRQLGSFSSNDPFPAQIIINMILNIYDEMPPFFYLKNTFHLEIFLRSKNSTYFFSDFNCV